MKETPRRIGRPKGSIDKVSRPGKKLIPEQVVEIRRLHDQGMDYAEIQRVILTKGFPQVSRQNIEHIVLRKIWKNAEDSIKKSAAG